MKLNFVHGNQLENIQSETSEISYKSSLRAPQKATKSFSSFVVHKISCFVTTSQAQKISYNQAL